MVLPVLPSFCLQARGSSLSPPMTVHSATICDGGHGARVL
jgi:hypothetical protein